MRGRARWGGRDTLRAWSDWRGKSLSHVGLDIGVYEFSEGGERYIPWGVLLTNWWYVKARSICNFQ
jgi:hypothetical protein